MGYPPTREGELWAAAQAGDARIVHSLLRVGTDPSKHVDPRAGSTALHEALAGGHAAVARVLLEACTPELLHWRDSHGRTPLLALAAGRAAVDGDEIGLDVAEELLRKDADPNARALDGTTAVHSAAKQGKRELLRMLAKHGASFHVRDRHGREALAYVTDDATERFMLQLIATIAVEPQTKPSKAIGTSWHRTNPGPPQQQQLEVHKDGRYGAAEDARVREHTKKQVITGSRLPAPPRAPPPPAPGKMPVKSMWPKSLQSDPMTRELTDAEMRRAEYMSIYLSATGITANGQPKDLSGQPKVNNLPKQSKEPKLHEEKRSSNDWYFVAWIWAACTQEL
ncbi:hypothetical protein AB1Y20_006847 [Prymnesium parvum]|uniref:Uncharacterized protein n=1 Tax=Prymnesium parvum TaxID=97485 RepID=A0AB34IZK9_PRYPA